MKKKIARNKKNIDNSSTLEIEMPPQLRKGKQEEQLIYHARKDLIEFACEDDQQDSILYLGFNQAQDDDEEFQIGEGEEEADMIFSEAQCHYTFTFQEYGDNGFIEVQKFISER